jgi:PIN domain nuclease of toxin-antitoxin system
VRALLDTSAFLWHVTAGGERIPEHVRLVIGDPANEILVSTASAWEIAIKAERGRLELPAPAERYVPYLVERYGFDVLPISLAHALRAGSLPPHHRDPFDRLLIAQAQIEGLSVVTPDVDFARYAVAVLW